MSFCTNCGQQNDDASRVCTNCGAALKTAPAAESWRAGSGSLNDSANETGSAGGGSTQGTGGSASTGYQPYTPASGSSSYTPPPAPSQYPAYTPPQMPYQQGGAGGAQPMHPAIPAIVSLFLPGIGLLFVPNKAGLGLGIFGAVVVYSILATILTFVAVGLCMFAIMPIFSIAAAIHSWDEAAKASNGQFQPILFK